MKNFIALFLIFNFSSLHFTINCMEKSDDIFNKLLEENKQKLLALATLPPKFIKAPEHLTKYQVFYALYRAAGPERPDDFLYYPNYGKPFFNNSEIDVLINQGYVGTVNRKFMHINFKDFPKLEVSSFEHINGEGSTLKILESYNKEDEEKENEIRKNHGRPWGVSKEEWEQAKIYAKTLLLINQENSVWEPFGNTQQK